MNDNPWDEFAEQDCSSCDLSNRDLALGMIGEPDLEAQLLAITSLICRNQQADEALAAEVKQRDEDIRRNPRRNEMDRMCREARWLEALHHSGFQSAAHSMAAVAMLAPFFESLFVFVFSGLRREYEQGSDYASSDDPRVAASQDAFWDSRFVFKGRGRRRKIAAGIEQLAHTTGLAGYLPSGCVEMLSALFEYRDRMFHLGFEWPCEDLVKFDNLVRSRKWPAEWFRKATRGDKPWIFYLSDEFITHCLKSIDEILEGVGAYYRKRQDLT